MRDIVLASFVLLMMPSFGAAAQPEADFNLYMQELAVTVCRPLQTAEKRSLYFEARPWLPSPLSMAAFNPHSGSNVLICARAEIELYIGSALAACIDPSFNRYYVIAGGVGIEAGISVSVFTLIYDSNSGSGIEGTYVGGKIGGAYGHIGGALGMYLKTSEVQIEGEKSDKLFWLGYVAGGNVDISASALKISTFQ